MRKCVYANSSLKGAEKFNKLSSPNLTCPCFSVHSTSSCEEPVRVLTFVVGLLCAGGIVGLRRVGISIENSRVVGNAAGTYSGGIHVEADSTLRVTITTVENNTAGDRGGESATFRALLTIIYLFRTAHGEQVLGSIRRVE